MHPSQSPAESRHTHARAQPGSVDTAAIQDGAVTAAKINASAFGLVGNITAIDPDDAAAAGATGLLADAGHQHRFTTVAPSALTKTATSTEGSGADMVRNDHVHATSALPWGIVARQILTGNSSGFTADATTDFALSSIVVDVARLYEVHLHTPWSLDAAGNWLVNFHVGGTLVDRLDHLNEISAYDEMKNASFLWLPSSGTVNVDVRVVEVSGASTLTFVATATATRQFWIEDIGPR